MQNGKRDLSDRTKRFALSVIRTFSMLPKTTEAQVLGKQLLQECDELIAISVTILNSSKEGPS